MCFNFSLNVRIVYNTKFPVLWHLEKSYKRKHFLDTSVNVLYTVSNVSPDKLIFKRNDL